MYLDFLEIGTSNFNTEIQEAFRNQKNLRGISVEPISIYLNSLQGPPRCLKVCKAVSKADGYATVYYVKPEDVQRYNLPTWVTGCNSIDNPHPTVATLLKNNNIPEDIIQKEIIEVTTIERLLLEHDVLGINKLKIDTEGHDPVILASYVELCKRRPELRALEIIFESNVLTSRPDLTMTVMSLIQIGYLLISSGEDTVMKLPLELYPYPMPEYFLPGYPENYDPSNLPHPNSLEGAMAYAKQNNLAGVTYEDDVYTVRVHRSPQHFAKPGLKSFLLTP